MNVFKDPKTGQGYVIYDDTRFDILIDSLSDDYLISKKNGKLLFKKKQESPAMVYYKGKYILVASGVDGFGPTETVLAYADNPLGQFTEKVIITKDRSWKSQVTDMFVIPDKDFILLMFDQWLVPDPKNIDRSR